MGEVIKERIEKNRTKEQNGKERKLDKHGIEEEWKETRKKET